MTTLHAQATDTTLHCDRNAMESNVVLVRYTLTDYNGAEILDYDLIPQHADVLTASPVLHAPATGTTLHAEK